MESTELFFPVPEAKGRAWKMELPTHPQWSPCGHGELLLILIGSFLSFHRIHVRSLHWVCRIVPKILNPWTHCTFGNVSSASTLASRQSNNILSYLFGSVWICWEKLNDVKWREMGRDWKILWLDDEPPSQPAIMGKYSERKNTESVSEHNCFFSIQNG